MESMEEIPIQELPGLSDMQNGNTENVSCESRILELPEKCIINIIKQVPLQNMDDIIELFPKWDKIVQDHIPVEVHLTDIGFRIAHHYFMSHRDLPKYRIKIIHSRVIDETLPELKCPEDLEVVEFATHTEPESFKTLVSKAINLKELHFGYGSLSGKILSDVEIHLPNLKLLSICDRPIEFRGNGEILPRNVIGFLSKSFPSIETLSVVTSAPRNQTKTYVETLLKFIQAHCTTLKVIKFNVMTALQNLSQTAADSGESETLADISSPLELGLDPEKLNSVNLTRLELTFGQNLFFGLEQWKSILQNQNKLKELNIGSDKPLSSSLYSVPISESSETLEILHLGIDVSTGNEPFDCSIVKHCSSLNSLTLLGPSFPEDEKERAPSAEISNVNALPQGLNLLHIENIYLETKQIAAIVEEHPNLKVLTLKNVGVKGAFGVTIQLLDSWIQSKRLKEINLKGMNEKNPQDLNEFAHLAKLGVVCPLSTCKVHAVYFPTFKEYRKPRENVVRPSFF